MIVKAENNMVFLEEVLKKSKKDVEYSQIILGDPKNYGRYTFYKRKELDTTGLMPNDKVQVTLEFTQKGYNTNVGLHSLKKTI